MIVRMFKLRKSYSVENTEVILQNKDILLGPRSVHCHDYYEFFLVEAGDAVHVVNGQPSILNKGSLVFIRPDDVHHFSLYKSNIYKMINVPFSVEVFNEVSTFVGNETAMLTKSDFPVSVQLSDSKLEFFSKQLREIHDMPVSPLRGSSIRLAIAQALMELLIPEKITSILPPWMSIMIRSLEDSLENQEKWEDIFEKSNKTREHICRSFRRYLGMTPSKYLSILRIRLAGKLIENGMHDIYDISEKCKFNNLSYFYRQFRSYYNMSPGEYIKQVDIKSHKSI